MAYDSEVLRRESQGFLVISISVGFALLSTISVALRLYTRSTIVNLIGRDDTTILAAQAMSIGVSVLTVLQERWGLGRHSQFVSEEDAVQALKCLYAVTLVYNAAQIIAKASFLILDSRVFPKGRVRRTCSWLLRSIIAWGIVQECLVAFACVPLSIINPTMKGRCIDALPIWYLTSCMNVFTDFIIFAVPIFPLLKLQLQMRRRLSLLALFCLGFVTCAISIVRLFTLQRGIKTTDPFWDNAPAAYWSVVELHCGILCACLPTLRPLFHRISPHTPRTTTVQSGLTTTRTNSSGLVSRRNEGRAIHVRKSFEMRSAAPTPTRVAANESDGGETAGHGAHSSRQAAEV